MSKSVLEVFEIEYCRGHRASADISSVLPCYVRLLRSSLLLVAYGVPYGFLDLDRDFHSFEKNANTLGKSKTLIRTSFGRFGASVFEMKTFEPD